MTYQSQAAGGFALAPALGVMFLYPTAKSNPGVGAVLPWGTKVSVLGTLSADSTIASGKVTLPAGYWYMLDGTAQALSATFDANDQLQYQWHDETSYIGTRGRVAFNATSSDNLLSSLRVLVNSGINNANNLTDAQAPYAGNGRGVIMQLSGAAP
jgi:hypothetical protein